MSRIIKTDRWSKKTFNTKDFLQPRVPTQRLLIGSDVSTTLAGVFGDASAFFNGDAGGINTGYNFFLNLAYGTSGLGFGGLFVAGHANGTPAAPTQTLAGNYIGGLIFTGFGTTTWATSGASHILPGLYSQALADVTDSTMEQSIFIGGLTTKMIGLDTSTNAIKLNEAQLSATTTIYYDLGTALTIDGDTGTTTVSNAISLPYVAKTANYTATTTDSTIDCTSGTFTVTLPTAVGCTGRLYTIKNSGTGVITIATTSSQTIDGVTTATLSTQYASLTVQSNNVNWILT